ncbi:MAG: DUF4340 domain-containing protein, partial [Acetobacteraceae bacterium]|nr:DUF4340 domain-containing protein [Acetobacteraceae bacterium]
MTPRTLVVLGGLALAATGVAAVLVLRQPPPATAPLVAGQLMFPGLVQRLQGAARVEITGKDGTLVLVRNGDVWGDAGRSGYPVQQARVREMFSALTELRLTEPRTADPQQLKALNLDAPGADSSALKLVVRDGASGVIAEAIVGRRRVRMAGNLPEAIYVRRPGENQAWLAEGNLRLDAEWNLWIDRDLLDIKRARIASAVLRQGETVTDLARATPAAERMEVENPPEGWRGDESKVDDVGRALEWLTLEDVKPATELAGAHELGTATWTLFDGTRVAARVVEKDGTRWTMFDVTWAAPATPPPAAADARTPEAAKAEAEAAQKRLAGWAYKLPDWKLATVLASAESMRAAAPPPAAAPPAAAS